MIPVAIVVDTRTCFADLFSVVGMHLPARLVVLLKDATVVPL